MSERKVLNKYYPPDFDPSKIPKGKRNRNATFNIRIMAPFNMRCNMCKEYIYKGKKFNSRKEDVMDEDYLGLRIFRFYIKCPRCVSEIAFKTDLLNTDYTLEAGAQRLFEAEKLAMQMAEQERKEKEDDEMNPMKVLENRTKASRQEMEQIDSLEELQEMNSRKNLVNTDEIIDRAPVLENRTKASRQEMEQIDSLEELREMNSRKNQVNTDEMIDRYRKYEQTLQQLQIEAEEQEIQDIFGSNSTKVVKRLHDSDSDEEGPSEKKKPAVSSSMAKPTDILAEEPKEPKKKETRSWERSVGSLASKNTLKGLVVKKKKTLPGVITAAQKDTATAAKPSMSPAPSDKQTNSAAPANSVIHPQPAAVNGNKDKCAQSSVENKNTDGGSVQNESDKSEGLQKNASGDKETVKSAAVVQNKVTPTVTGGLGLLGGYADSDSSETSD